jgi:hypothetical protein
MKCVYIQCKKFYNTIIPSGFSYQAYSKDLVSVPGCRHVVLFLSITKSESNMSCRSASASRLKCYAEDSASSLIAFFISSFPTFSYDRSLYLPEEEGAGCRPALSRRNFGGPDFEAGSH